jgi:AcrR family transcriptional regulator
MPSSNRPRRQAKQDRARVTVDVVLEAAARILMEQGYAAATTNRIAEAAGVSVGTIYEYFANKEEVFDALIQREIDHLVAAIAGQSLRAQDTVDVKVAQLAVAAMGAVRFGPGLFRALEQASNSTFRGRLAQARQAVIAFVKGLLEQHRAELRVTDLELAAFVVVSAAEGVGANASDDVFDERLARELAALIKAYLVGTDSVGTD